MCTELASTLDTVAIFHTEIVDGADIIKTTTGYEVAGWCVGAGHDPTGTKWDSVDFVGCIGIPEDEFAVLRSGNEMTNLASL